MAKTYKEVYADLIKGRGTQKSNYSKADRLELMHTALNDSGFERPIVTKKGNDAEITMVKPVQKLRDSLVAPLKKAGLDAEGAKEAAANFEFTKTFAEAMIETSDVVNRDYLDTGRKLNMVMTSTNEAQAAIQLVDVKEKIKATKAPEKQEDGSTVMVPTGKTIKTAGHDGFKVKAKVPVWLKEEVEVK